MYNVHSISHVTEGGILGMTLLLEHWFHVSPAVSSILMDIVCYGLGWKVFGKTFLFYSFLSAGSFSLFYALFSCFPRVYPEIADMPLAAAVIGALFVGIGAGLCVRAGGAESGDDAIAMAVSYRTGMSLASVYFISDAVVLLLSLSYIPVKKILYSLLTVTLSGQIISLTVKIGNDQNIGNVDSTENTEEV